MKYTGRIFLLIVFLFASITDYVIGKDIEIIMLVIDFLIAIFAWIIGGFYDKYRFLSYHDYLTQVYNRRYGDKVLPKLLKRFGVNNAPVAVLNVDINNFKLLNDTYGHQVGDLALKKFANILIAKTSKKDIVIRWGGDEFLVVCPGLSNAAAQDLVKQINQKVDREVGQSYYDKLGIGLSIGIAIFPEDGQTLDELLNAADKKMYETKSFKKQTF